MDIDANDLINALVGQLNAATLEVAKLNAIIQTLSRQNAELAKQVQEKADKPKE